jgi:hypothetical protein
MAWIKQREGRLSGGDLNFLIETVSPEVKEKSGLGRIIQEDEDFRKSYVGDEKVFRRVMGDEEILLKISPSLFFEILLRRTASDLEAAGYTLETDRTMKIPIFDTREVLDLLVREPVLLYLAGMLSSFTRVESYTLPVRVGKRVWEKIRFNDLDIQSLKSICDVVDDEYRLGLYKRIADICLFILGIFPDYARRDYRYPFSGQPRPHLRGKFRISPEDYEKEGRRFYHLAAEERSARELGLSGVFEVLHNHFQKAKKALNFLAENYLRYTRQKLFA